MTSFFLDIETGGLHSIKDRILCISIMNPDHSTPISFYGESESKILEQFFNATKSASELIGYNINSFDLPFIIKRALINKVHIPDNFLSIKLIDLMLIVNSFFISYNKHEPGKLSEWAAILGIPVQTEQGNTMPECYEKKDWKTIKEHCEEDVLICKALLQRIQECNLKPISKGENKK